MSEARRVAVAAKRGRGRPRKHERPSLHRAIVERGIHDAYDSWLGRFKRDRKLAWLGTEALRLRAQHPDAPVWRRVFDLGEEKDRRAYSKELAGLGARPLPPTGLGPPRNLALAATAQQCKAGWEAATGRPLTSSVVARIVARERSRRAGKPE